MRVFSTGEEENETRRIYENEEKAGRGKRWMMEISSLVGEWSGRGRGKGRICEWRTHVPLDRRSRRGKLRRREISSILYIMRGIIRLVEREIAPVIARSSPSSSRIPVFEK